MRKTDHNDEQLPPFLAKAGKEPPFPLPEGYFNSLPDRVIARIHNIPTPAEAKSYRFSAWFGKAAAVAGFLMILSVSSWFYFQPGTDELALETIDLQSLPAEEFEEDMLMEQLALQEPAPADSTMDYLLDYIDEDLLIEQL